jgi:hypothetical protein
MSKEQALAEAEAFIRRTVARAPDGKVDEAAIRAAAAKVVKALPPSPSRKLVAA